MNDTFVVALTQMTSVDDVSKNLSQILLILERILSPVDLVCFPENCLYLRVQEGESIPFLKLSDPIFQQLAGEAKNRKLNLHLGSVPLELPEGRFNSSVFIDQQGGVQASYQKIHLFDIQLEGQDPIRESDVFRHGSGPSILELGGWRIGQSVCYDLRFSELYSFYAEKEVDLVLVPSAFLVKTGEAHWETLLRARAIETQAYVVASAQAGQHQSVKTKAIRQTYGHSLGIDPWGQVLVKMTSSPGVEILTLSRGRISEVRRQIPMKNHRRL